MMKHTKSFRQVGLSALLMTVLFSGCAHRPSAPGVAEGAATPEVQPNSSNETAAAESGDEAPQVTLRDVESFRVTDPEGPHIADSELDQIPTEINPLVEKWIAYFQGRGRPFMERYLSRSTRYSKLMKKILRQNGLPEDLIYIALIESGFSSQATSHAAAVGYWQFIKGTGRRYGLEINALVDERRDPVMSTQAAAEYFKGLYSVFGSWYLAMASYNVGENRVKREVMNHYTRDFWELARKRRFPKETINYVPKFIAAKLIGNDPAKYGFTDVEYLTPIEFEHIKIEKPVDLNLMAQKMGIDYDELKTLNPKFKGQLAPLKNGKALELRVPLGQTQAGLVAAQAAAVEKVEYVADAGDTQIHRVRNGESLHTIAKKYRTTVAWLRDMNDLKKGRKLRIGQKLAVPERGGKKAVVVKYVAKAEKAEKAEKVDKSEQDSEKAMANPEVVTKKGVFYVVQSGDTLSAIADDYNSSVEELRRMNKMSRGTVLKAGMRLKVPKDDGLPADPNGNKASEAVADRDSKDDSDSNEDSSNQSKGPAVASKADGGTKASPATNAKLARVASAEASDVVADKGPMAASSRHVVRPGENLTTIARKYGVTIHSIRKANNLTKRSMLKVGSRLLIPEDRPQTKTNNKSQRPEINPPRPIEISLRKARRPRVHVVKRGENLTQIAEKYRIPLQTLRQENKINLGSKLFVGAKILIPSAQASVE